MQAEGNGADGAHVGGDLFAALAVSPCGCPFKNPVAVTEGKRIAIDLQLAHQFQWTAEGAIDRAEEPLIPSVEIVAIERIVQTEQSDAVLNVREALGGSAPHPLGGAIGGF